MMKKLALFLLGLLLTEPALAQQCIVGSPSSKQVVPQQATAVGTTGALTITLPAAANQYTYVCGFTVTSVPGASATAGVRAVTLSGIATTMNWSYLDPASGQGFVGIAWPTCIPSTAVNTAITLTVPATTATNIAASSSSMWGCNQ